MFRKLQLFFAYGITIYSVYYYIIITLDSNEKKKNAKQVMNCVASCLFVSMIKKGFKGAHLVDDVAIDETSSDFLQITREHGLCRAWYLSI